MTATQHARRVRPQDQPRLVDADGDDFVVTFPPDPELLHLVREVPGAAWDGRRCQWRVSAATDGVLDAVRALPLPHSPTARALLDGTTVARPRIRVEITDFIEVWFPFSRELNKAMRRIPGAAYPNDHWKVAPTGPGAAGVRVFCADHRIPLSAEQDQALEAMAADADGLHALSRALELGDDADRAFDVPGFRCTLRPFQRAGVAYGARVRRVLIADEMGLGKTPQALGILQSLGAYPTLIVAPDKVRKAWCRAARDWLPEGTRIAAVVAPSTPPVKIRRLEAEGFIVMAGQPRPGVADVYVTTYPLVHTQVDAFKACGLQGLILDESHFVKTRDKTKVCATCTGPVKRKKVPKVVKGQTKTVTAWVCETHGETKASSVYSVLSVRAAKDLSLVIPADGMIVALSATPNKNTTQDFVPQLDILGLLERVFGGEWKFLTRFCGAYREKHGWITTGSSNLGELNDLLRATCYVQRDKAAVMPDLPAFERLPDFIDLPESALASYRKAEEDLIAFVVERAMRLAEEAGEDVHRAGWKAKLAAESAEHLVRIGTLRREAGLAKIPAARDWARRFTDETGRKLLTFSHHLEVNAALAEELGCDRIDGTAADTDPSVDAFQNDPAVKSLVIGIMAGGVGITLTAASDGLFVEQAWTPGDLDQAEARYYGRINDAHGGVGHYLLAADTIDEDMWDLLEEKRVVEAAARRGGEAAKLWEKRKKESVMGGVLVRMAERGLRQLGLDVDPGS